MDPLPDLGEDHGVFADLLRRVGVQVLVDPLQFLIGFIVTLAWSLRVVVHHLLEKLVRNQSLSFFEVQHSGVSLTNLLP